MKNFTVILILIFLSGCATKKSNSLATDTRNLSEIDGLIYQIHDDEPFSGEAVGLYGTGERKSKLQYVDGRLDGLIETYYKDGQLESRTEYTLGGKNGLQEVFYESGEVLTQIIFKDGTVVDQDYIMYHPDEAFRAKGTYRNGRLDGLLERYDKEGNVTMSLCYEDGKVNTAKTTRCDTDGTGNSLIRDVPKDMDLPMADPTSL